MTEIAISGAGIGGLVTALCLKYQGFDVTVFEADTEIRALGVGINIMPHASKLLIELGLGRQLDELGILLVFDRVEGHSLDIVWQCGLA